MKIAERKAPKGSKAAKVPWHYINYLMSPVIESKRSWVVLTCSRFGINEALFANRKEAREFVRWRVWLIEDLLRNV